MTNASEETTKGLTVAKLKIIIQKIKIQRLMGLHGLKKIVIKVQSIIGYAKYFLKQQKNKQ